MTRTRNSIIVHGIPEAVDATAMTTMQELELGGIKWLTTLILRLW